MARKPKFENFAEWALKELGFDPHEKAFQIWVETNAKNVRNAVESHGILSSIQEYINSNQASKKRQEVNLISREVSLDVKSVGSILSKLYRQNVSQNENFPEQPPKGWITPDNMFARLNDIVRTTIVCRHIDEPAKIAAKIEEFAKAQSLTARKTAQAKEDGYYAYHVYIKVPTTLVKRDWEQFSEDVQFEIQVTTQMQHMLYELTHVFYNKERDLLQPDKNSWKWDYKSSRFSASYLSHTLHMLEGMILRLYEEIENNTENEQVPEQAADLDGGR